MFNYFNLKIAKSFTLLLVIFVAGCSSYFKRKDCESTNWFDYGQKVALDGRRLSGDQFISECYQAEADVAESDLDRGFKSGMEKYCQPETVYITGRNGNFFSTEMCVGQGLNTLQAKHKAGVVEYCQKSNGYSAGARGKPYNKICPAHLEAAFLKEFNRGRKKFIVTVLSENNQEISRLENQITRTQVDLRFKSSELSRYQYSPSQDEKTINLVNNLSSQVRNLEYSISQDQSKLNSLRAKTRDLQLELVQIDN